MIQNIISNRSERSTLLEKVHCEMKAMSMAIDLFVHSAICWHTEFFVSF